MAAFWVFLIVGAAVIATVELVFLQRQRQRILSNHSSLAASHTRTRVSSDVHLAARNSVQRTFRRRGLLGARGKRALKKLILPVAVRGQRLLAGIAKRLPDDGHRSDPDVRSLTRVVQQALSDAQTTVDAVLAPTAEVSGHHPTARPTDAAPPVTSAPELGISAAQASRKLKCHAARSVLYWMSFEEAAEPGAVAAGPRAEPSAVPASPASNEPRHQPVDGGGNAQAPVAEEGVAYVDATGRFTFANPAARALLRWTAGELALSDVLVGGSQESAALLYAVARQELIGRPVTLSGARSSEQLEMSGLPFRDRNGNLWGAALFIRRAATPVAPRDIPSAPSRP